MMALVCIIFESFDIFSNIKLNILYPISFGILSISCLVMFLFPDWRISLGMMWLVGISFGINDLIPYILISRYHNSLIFRLKVRYYQNI